MVSDTVAKILEREPDWESLPAGLPDSIRTLVRRCLKKNPAERRHDLADVDLELRAHCQRGRPRARRRRAGWKAHWPMFVVGPAGVSADRALAVFASGHEIARTGRAPCRRVEFGIRLPDNHLPSTGIAVSPDGRYIAAGVFEQRAADLDALARLRPSRGLCRGPPQLLAVLAQIPNRSGSLPPDGLLAK